MRIIVSEPRRFAAISLAKRVAEEKMEKLGKTAGYIVRLDKVLAQDENSVTFVTVGVILKMLQVDFHLSEYSILILGWLIFVLKTLLVQRIINFLI